MKKRRIAKQIMLREHRHTRKRFCDKPNKNFKKTCAVPGCVKCMSKIDGLQPLKRTHSPAPSTPFSPTPPGMIPVLLLALPSLAAAVALGGADPLHFPLTRRQVGELDLGDWVKAAEFVRNKYGYGSPQRRQSTSAVPITNQV